MVSLFLQGLLMEWVYDFSGFSSPCPSPICRLDYDHLSIFVSNSFNKMPFPTLGILVDQMVTDMLYS